MLSFLKKQNPIFRDELLAPILFPQYLSQTMTPQQRKSPITDPMIIMMEVNRCNSIKQKIIQESWKSFPRVREDMNLLPNNSDQLIDVIMDQFQFIKDYINQTSSLDGKYYNTYSYDIDIQYYPGTIIFSKYPYQQIQINESTTFVSNKVSNLQEYDYPNQIFPLSPYQFTSLHNKYQQPLSQYSVSQIDMYDKRILIGLTQYLQETNPKLYFTTNNNFYIGSIMKKDDSYTTLYLERSEMMKQKQFTDYVQLEEAVVGQVYIMTYAQNQPPYSAETIYISHQTNPQDAIDEMREALNLSLDQPIIYYIYITNEITPAQTNLQQLIQINNNDYTLTMKEFLTYSTNELSIYKALDQETQIMTPYAFEYQAIDTENYQLVQLPIQGYDETQDPRLSYLKEQLSSGKYNYEKNFTKTYTITFLQQWMPYFITFIQNLTLESRFLLNIYQLENSQDPNYTNFLIQMNNQTIQELNNWQFDTQYIIQDLKTLSQFDIIKCYITLPKNNE